MKPNILNSKTILSICLAFVFAVFTGCGGNGGLLDEVEGRYALDLLLQEADEDTVDIDVNQDVCDADADPIELEPWTNTYGNISIDVDSDAPGIDLLSYVVHYYEVESVRDGAPITPPVLESKDRQSLSFYVGSGQSATSPPIIVMTTDVRDIVNDSMLSGGGYYNALYTIEVEVTFREDSGEEKTLSFFQNAILNNFLRCN
jgi:hypothetical protein